MKDLAIVGACLGTVLALLAAESLLIRCWRRSVPDRIVVMGTRGKSSVVRLIAAGLRAGGRRVLFKTTGSQALLGRPDGEERTVRRRSLPTPLEQRRTLHSARRAAVDALVVEAMSIRAESLHAEVAKILSPRIAVITCVRPDHLRDLPDPVGAFAGSIPQGCSVVCPRDTPADLLQRLAARRLSVHTVEPDAGTGLLSALPYQEWPSNLSLALNV